MIEEDIAQTKIDAIPARFRDHLLEDEDVQAWVNECVEAAHRSVEGTRLPIRWGGPQESLILLGRTGCGKTHIAYAAYQQMLAKRLAGRILWANAADFYASIRPNKANSSEEILKKHQQANVLFLDDLGAAKESEWVEEINYRLINYRYENMLPTLITANVPPPELEAKLGDRVASRLQDMGRAVILKGKDRRTA